MKKLMRKLLLVLLVAFTMVTLGVAPTAAAAWVDIETVTVGDVDNAADTTGYGAVSYEYQIGKYEVTNTQYVAFLNAVATESDSHGLYNENMGNDSIAGITRSGSAGNWDYSVKSGTDSSGVSYANKPVAYVSFYDAARFANWLTTGDTESGLYTFDGDGKFVSSPDHATSNGWAIASEDEWYKAAYYDGNGSYREYPVTGELSTSLANYENFKWDANALKEVGAYDLVNGSSSNYKTQQQGGNVFEWVDLPNGGDTVRGMRGGSYYSYSENDLVSSGRSEFDGGLEDVYSGFRVVSLTTVPEPGTYGILGGAAALLGAVALRRRNRRD